MSIKVLSYHESPHGSYQLGFAIVQIKQKSNMIVKVCNSKSDKVFCVAPSIKIGEKWLPTIDFIDKAAEKKFFETIREQVLPLMTAQPEQKQTQQDQHTQDDCPF